MSSYESRFPQEERDIHLTQVGRKEATRDGGNSTRAAVLDCASFENLRLRYRHFLPRVDAKGVLKAPGSAVHIIWRWPSNWVQYRITICRQIGEWNWQLKFWHWEMPPLSNRIEDINFIPNVLSGVNKLRDRLIGSDWNVMFTRRTVKLQSDFIFYWDGNIHFIIIKRFQGLFTVACCT